MGAKSHHKIRTLCKKKKKDRLEIKVKINSLLLSSTIFASCHFMGAGRRYEVPIREAKDFTARGTASSTGFQPMRVPGPARGNAERPGRNSDQAVSLNSSW